MFFKPSLIRLYMVLISLCMITRDEEEFLPRCLESIKGLVDEIIVLDSSSDRTAEIAEGFGAKVFNYKWEGDFSKARNLSLEKAGGKWILVLDADESIAEKDLHRLKELVKKGGFDGLSFAKRNYTNNEFLVNFVSSEGDGYKESEGFKGYVKVPIVRLFRNDPKIRFERAVHEVVEHSIRRAGGKVISTDVPIHHFKELKGEGVSEKKQDKYSRTAEKMAAVNPLDAKAHFDTGFGYFKKGEHEKAVECYKKAIEANPAYLEPRFGLSEVYVAQGNLKEAAEVNEGIVQSNPGISAAYYNLGELYLTLKEYEKALVAYKKALELGSPQRARILEILPQLQRILDQKEGMATYSVTLG